MKIQEENIGRETKYYFYNENEGIIATWENDELKTERELTEEEKKEIKMYIG